MIPEWVLKLGGYISNIFTSSHAVKIEGNVEGDFNYYDDIEEIDQSRELNEIRLRPGRSDTPLVFRDDVLEIYPEELEEQGVDVRDRALSYISNDGFEQEGAVYREDAYSTSEVVKKYKGKERINETLRFFDGKIDSQYYRIVKPCLYLREAIEADDSVDPRIERGEIANKFGPVAYDISHLVSSGYLDKGRYIRDIHNELEASEDWRVEQFRKIFDEIVEDLPFTVFVSPTDNSREIAREAMGKLRTDYMYTYEFLDIRGIGAETIIDQAIKQIEFGSKTKVQYNKIDTQGPDYVIRIDKSTFNSY